MASSSAISRAEILSLYRSLLRTARQFCDYNIREYTKRRIIDAFCENRNLSDPSTIYAAFSDVFICEFPSGMVNSMLDSINYEGKAVSFSYVLE
ncbi:hypothetical protein GH714_040888 [Hevea brasiliensis]|uniref:Complex 1 LYR protein domain-containing protein n=1 Tax=Hevea brasiliensis TaxID=3981 RepID=A0A6A6MKD1_HEVBR|nr:hypothetical protein GH714_040888 [Hevea brasiliensis]